MRDPTSVIIKKPTELDWSADTNSEIVHLTKQGFEPALKDEKSVLVMFYAPCKYTYLQNTSYRRIYIVYHSDFRVWTLQTYETRV